MTTTEQNIHFGLLGAALALAVGVFAAEPHSAGPATHGGARSHETDERSALSIIPPGSAFLLSADLRSFTRTPLGTFIAERLQRSAGASKFLELCGFDPLTRLDQLALAVPSPNLAAPAPDFAIVGRGSFRAADITRCARSVINARSGEAIQTKLGSFDSVRDRKASSGEIAAKDGLVVVSGGSYLRELLDSAEGQPGRDEARDVRDARHAELRRALGPGSLLATWLLGEGWFERVAGEGTNAKLSPLSALKTVSARVDVGQTAELRVLLECADSEGAAHVSSLLGELRASLGVLPLDPALAQIAGRITVSQKGARLQLGLELKQAELSPVLDALLGP
ncbi:MAG TPA: hypothetical protein VER04_01665 [Polyangiaceae bacterium]|nr:hypothetical protein [Polyangiaceae bacterium]